MAATTPTEPEIALMLRGAERGLLQDMLQQALRDTRVEMHRTHTPDYREAVQHQEELIRGVLAKLAPS